MRGLNFPQIDADFLQISADFKLFVSMAKMEYLTPYLARHPELVSGSCVN